MNSVLVNFHDVGAGIKPTMGHNHLRNNDGMNLSALKTFTSKEIYKGNAFEPSKQPYHVRCDHQERERVMDEYNSSIFIGAKNTIVLHNTPFLLLLPSYVNRFGSS
ncbi:hypothetical protein AB3S75_002867 [Citrus x aurantiifolia]